jgi:XTP/dITP diphosphohydrolase
MRRAIIFATHNQHKVDEVSEILAPLGVQVIGGAECNLPDVEETGKTFEENAIIKALAGVKILSRPVLAEDAGLCIEGLDGAPGVYSARFAQSHGGFDNTFKYIADALKDKSRKAYYTSSMVLAFSETEYYVFTGYMHGQMAESPSGTNGFGYDPMFIPDGFDTTLGHIDAETKNKISHRSKAIQQVYKFLETIKKA